VRFNVIYLLKRVSYGGISMAGSRLLCVLIIVCGFSALAGCKNNVEKQRLAAVKAGQQNEAAASAGAAAKSDEADNVKPASAEGAGAAASAPVEAVREKPKSKYHPAAKERDYDYVDMAGIWNNEEEREVVEFLTRAATAEKAYKIIKKNPAKFTDLLRRTIRAEHREVRIQTAVIIGLLKDKTPETSTVMADAILLDSDPDVRAIAAKAFIVLKAKSAVDVLIRSLDEDPYEAARANAAWALGIIGDMAALPHLRKATKDDDTFVRLRAVSALFKLKSKQAIPELIARLDDKSPMVRERAHQALREITGSDKGKTQDAWLKIYGKVQE
jgi:hypothetical protein